MLSLSTAGERLLNSPKDTHGDSLSSSGLGQQRGWLEHVGRSADTREEECLARNVYYEAGGETFSGKVAVAAVTLNRVDDPRFPKTICGVVEQRSGGCQFSWMCNGRGRQRPRGAAWEEARDVADILLHVDWFDPTRGAKFFHATYVQPRWSFTKSESVQIGNHIFYRDDWSTAAGTDQPPS